MPIFEYACRACGNTRFSRLVGVVASASAVPTCPRCGSSDLQKLVSRFAGVRSENDVIENLADTADQMDENDPRAVRHFLHDMAGSMGEDMTADDMEQIMDEATTPSGDAAAEAASSTDEAKE